MSKNKITYQGITYSSERTMCKELNFSYTTYLARKRKGMTLEEIFNTPIGNQITYQGITYSNEKEMCKALGFPYGTYRYRRNKGMGLDEIFNILINNNNQIMYQGVTYSNGKEMCRILNFPYNLYKDRKKAGWTLNKIFNTPVGAFKGNQITYQGITYSSERTMCKALNFPYTTYKNRKRKKWTLNKIFNTPIDKSVIYQRITYFDKKAMCKALNFPYSAYLEREKRGWKLEKIFNTPIDNRQGIQTVYKGIEYSSERKMCEALKFSYDTYKKRRKIGLTLEEALTIPIHMSLGEYRIKESLKRRQIKYKYNKTLKTIFKEFKLDVPWEEFINVLYEDLKSKGITIWSKETISKLKPDFVLYKDKNNKIIGIIEFDGEQHFGLLTYFYKTVQQFIYRCDCDTAKNKFFEFMSLPLLRIRYDQVDLIEPILDDFLAHPEEYISKKHNPYLTEEEYWAELYDTLKKIDDDELGYNLS